MGAITAMSCKTSGGIFPTHFDRAPTLTGLMTWSVDLSTLLVLEGLLQRLGVAVAHHGDKDTGSTSSGKYPPRGFKQRKSAIKSLFWGW